MTYRPRKSPALGRAHDQLGGKDHQIIKPDNDIKLSKVSKIPTAVVVSKMTRDGEICIQPGFVGRTQYGEVGMPLYPYIKLHYVRQAAKKGCVVHFTFASDGEQADLSLIPDKIYKWDTSFGRIPANIVDDGEGENQ